jgi:aerotaxis receptor
MNRVVPKDEEYIFQGKVAISQTDLNGNITFVNRKYCEVSGYNAEELVGSNQNIVRHPDVQDAIFEKMYKTLGSGQAYNGVLKNLRKDGLYYWVDIEIMPILDENEHITGYISVSKPSPRKNIQENEKLLQNNSTN